MPPTRRAARSPARPSRDLLAALARGARSSSRRLVDARRVRDGAAGGSCRCAACTCARSAAAGGAARTPPAPSRSCSKCRRRIPRRRACSKSRSIPVAGSATGIFRCSGTAAHLGALVLEIERSRCSWRAPGLLDPQPAAPRRRRAAHRIDASHADAAVGDRARRGDRFHRAARRRERRRQGTGRAADSRVEPARATGHSSPSTARRWSRRCSRRSCSASRSGPRPACAAGAASSKPPKAARCFSTKSRTCRCPRRPSCCARFRIWRSSASAGMAPIASTSGSSRRPIAASRRWSSSGCSAPICSIASAASISGCRRCASGAPDILELAQYFLERHAPRGRCVCRPARRDALDDLRLAGQRARARTADGTRCRAWSTPTSIELDDLPPRVRGDYAPALGPSVAAQRQPARVGEPLRAAGARALRRATSAKPAACSTSATTRCRRICASRCTIRARIARGIEDEPDGGRKSRWNRWSDRNRGASAPRRRVSPANSGKRGRSGGFAVRSRVFLQRCAQVVRGGAMKTWFTCALVVLVAGAIAWPKSSVVVTGAAPAAAQSNTPVQLVPGGQRQAGNPGEKGATYYALEAQTTRLTTKFHDGHVAVAERGLIGEVKTTVRDRGGNERARLKVNRIDGGHDLVHFEPSERRAVSGLERPGQRQADAGLGEPAGLRPRQGRHRGTWCGTRAPCVAKDAAARHRGRHRRRSKRCGSTA